MKERRVSGIKYGTVIDHIPSMATFKIVDILNFENELLTIGNNLSSHKLGKKGIVKISDRLLSKEELGKISLIAPEVSVCKIKNYKVVKKSRIELPKKFINVVQCVNPNCITRHEKVTTIFEVLEKKPVTIKCKYCEHTFADEEIVLL